MPIELPPLTRRQFLRGTAAIGGAFAVGSSSVLRAIETTTPATTQAAANPNLLALCSDTHVAADRARLGREINMFDQFAQVTREIIAMPMRPAGVLINGDCAYNAGLAEDYVSFVAGVKPLREAGLPVHLTLGNHDNRQNFLAAIPKDEARVADAPVADHVVGVLRLPTLDWYILDSLHATRSTPGVIGPEQLAWLARSLDAEKDKPAVIMLHHQTDDRPVEKRSGLVDTEALMDVINPRKQAKAVLYGHRHVWEWKQKDGLHFVNLPTTAYLFNDREPAGWVEAHCSDKGMSLKLHAIRKDHPKNNDTLELAWR